MVKTFTVPPTSRLNIAVTGPGSDVPELRTMTSRLIVANADTLKRRHDVFVRFMQGFRATLDWLYSDPKAIAAYAAWSGLPEHIARKAPEFLTKENMDPTRISGLNGVMADAVKFKYLTAPLSDAPACR